MLIQFFGSREYKKAIILEYVKENYLSNDNVYRKTNQESLHTLPWMILTPVKLT